MKSWGNLLFRRLLVMLVSVSMIGSGILPAHAQSSSQSPPAPQAKAAPEAASLKPEEIEALVAPIALYPDDLLSQVLMASTYPLEVVQAARWVKANPNVKGDEAVKAVADQTWDVSVKSMVAFPQVLEPMNEKIDWTQKLGDAFLDDQKAVLDAVQRLRAKAQANGNLKTTEQQKVVVEQQVIIIEPAKPDVIYVPAYNPTVVYGVWGYPGYPPYYWPPSPIYYPGGWYGGAFAWGVAWGFAAGAIFGGCNWGRGDVNINVNKAVNIDRNFDRNKVGSGGRWEHNANHRQGVAYRDNASRQKYGRDVGGADRRQDYRGRDVGAADRAGTRPGDRAGDRAGTRPGDRGGAADRSAGISDRSAGIDRGAASRDNAFSGVGSGGASQRDFNRGTASDRSMSSNRGGGFSGGGGASARPSPAARPAPSARPSGGMSRGGGGRGGRR
jgi:hypothetical protein